MIAGALVSLTAQSLGWLIAGRGMQAFGTATGIVVARAIVSDRYPVERMAKVPGATHHGGRARQFARPGAGRLPRGGLELARDFLRC